MFSRKQYLQAIVNWKYTTAASINYELRVIVICYFSNFPIVHRYQHSKHTNWKLSKEKQWFERKIKEEKGSDLDFFHIFENFKKEKKSDFFSSWLGPGSKENKGKRCYILTLISSWYS